jgi:hypothetical protein
MIEEAFNLDNLLIPEVAPIADAGQLASKPKPRRKSAFVMVPIEWMHHLAGARYTATIVLALHLLHLAFKVGIKRSRSPTAGLSCWASPGRRRVGRWRSWKRSA